MQITSAEANKRLKKLEDELSTLIIMETKTSVFNAAVGEDEEKIRPAYDFSDTQKKIEDTQEKIIELKHKINEFNLITHPTYSWLSIDQTLVLLPMLNERKRMLDIMKRRLPRERARSYGTGTNAVIDYTIANYNIEEAAKEYDRISDEIAKLQTDLDTVNSTVKGIEVDD